MHNFFNSLIHWDQETLIALNNAGVWWLDEAMIQISGTLLWLPFYCFLLYKLIKLYQWNTIWQILMVVLTITFCDQLASGIAKPLFERLRPCHEPAIMIHLRMITECGGMYGYFSSHASNSFGIASLLFFIMNAKKQYVYLFVWAALVSYSRIYLGKHYPLDVLTGALVGTAGGWMFARLGMWLIQRYPVRFK